MTEEQLCQITTQTAAGEKSKILRAPNSD